MSTFWLRIVASDHVFYNGNCDMLVVPAQDGEFGFQAHHESVILAIEAGELRFRQPGSPEWIRAIVGRGIIQMANNRAAVLVDSAERPEDIDRVRAEEALERAKEQMRQKQSIQEFWMSQASMARALARLRGSSKLKELK